MRAENTLLLNQYNYTIKLVKKELLRNDTYVHIYNVFNTDT